MDEADVPHDPVSTALQAVLVAHTRAQAALARRLGVRRGDVDALEHLMAGDLGASDLAGRLGVSPGAVSQLVDRLERRGHAVRRVAGTDRRRALISLTDEGRGTVLRHVAPMLVDLDRLHGPLGPDGREAVVGYLTGARAALLALAEEDARAGAEVGTAEEDS